MKKTFTINEIAHYIAGWTMGSFGEVQALGKATLMNALSQLECDQDGIAAYIGRCPVPPKEFSEGEDVTQTVDPLLKRHGWLITVRRSTVDTCVYNSTIGPVNQEHVLTSPAVKEWIGDAEIISIVPKLK